MLRKLTTVFLLALAVGCASPDRIVYSSGFSFANYDFVMIAKPDGPGATTLYGMDVEVANLLSKYNMNIVGDKEFLTLPTEKQKRTLLARMSLSASDDNIVMTVTFDDAVSGRTGASVTGGAEGDIFDGDDRGDAFEAVSHMLIKALAQDKGLTISR